MIYTVTFNPSIDYVVHSELSLGEVNRASSEQIYFGGKGINVSAVLAQLDIESTALGFTAGFTGEAIEKGVAAMGIKSDFVRLSEGFSRINVKIKSCKETELNGVGPVISDADMDKLYKKLDNIKNGDTLVLAGSVPRSIDSDIYEQILKRLDDRGIRTVVDAEGELLLNVLKYKPFLIKPNHHELAGLFKKTYTKDFDIELHARKLQEMGAKNVLVSMAENGSVLLDENGEVHKCAAFKGTVRNSVGAGDSMLAGFLAGVDKGYEYALKLGTASGGATAFSDGIAEKKDILALLDSSNK